MLTDCLIQGTNLAGWETARHPDLVRQWETYLSEQGTYFIGCGL
jgi:hypothetical protein